ncbi:MULTISPECIES: HNH endonuclease [unclassified Streptomyces]|nr:MULTISPECIES: HNH endonuclease [unclassified Streptomyces]
MDHVIPLSKGGRHAIGNLMPACMPCNMSKSASFLSVWRAKRQRG